MDLKTVTLRLFSVDKILPVDWYYNYFLEYKKLGMFYNVKKKNKHKIQLIVKSRESIMKHYEYKESKFVKFKKIFG